MWRNLHPHKSSGHFLDLTVTSFSSTLHLVVSIRVGLSAVAVICSTSRRSSVAAMRVQNYTRSRVDFGRIGRKPRWRCARFCFKHVSTLWASFIRLWLKFSVSDAVNGIKMQVKHSSMSHIYKCSNPCKSWFLQSSRGFRWLVFLHVYLHTSAISEWTFYSFFWNA